MSRPLDPGRYETSFGMHDIEIREDPDGDGRTVTGVAVPYNEVADVGAYREMFAYGAFRAQIQDTGSRGVSLRWSHQR